MDILHEKMRLYINLMARIGIHGDVESTVKTLLSGEGGELESEGRSKRIICLPGQPVADPCQHNRMRTACSVRPFDVRTRGRDMGTARETLVQTEVLKTQHLERFETFEITV